MACFDHNHLRFALAQASLRPTPTEVALAFGLGSTTEASEVEITWPSGQHDMFHGLAAGATYTLQEGGKILGTRPFRKRSVSA